MLGTVRNIRRRFHEEGMQAALVKPRPGAVPKVTGEVEAQLTMRACSGPPEGCARWTLRLLAEEMVRLEYVDTISHVTVGEHLKKTNCSLGKWNPGASVDPRRATWPRWRTYWRSTSAPCGVPAAV